MDTFYVITESGSRIGPYRTVSAAWSALLMRTGSIECHNHSGHPDIPEVYILASHHADGSWETHNVVEEEADAQ